MQDIKNKIKYFIVPVVLLFVVFIFVRTSYANTELREEVVLTSEHANFIDNEHNSWGLQKTAYWISPNEAEIKLEVHSNPYDPKISDYFFLVDLTSEDSVYLIENFIDEGLPIDSEVTLIGFDTHTDVYTIGNTNADEIIDLIYDMYDDVHSSDNVDYYELLLTLEDILSIYEFNEEHSTKVIFVGYPYEGLYVYNQEEEFKHIRESYPEIEFYYANTADITSTGFLNKQVDFVGNDLELITSSNVIKDFVITDVIDTDYFEYEGIIENSYKYVGYRTCHWIWDEPGGVEILTTSQGINNYCYESADEKAGKRSGRPQLLSNRNSTRKSLLAIEMPGGPSELPEGCVCDDTYYGYNIDTAKYDEETNKITWNLSDSIYSTYATLRLKVNLKDEFIGSEEIFTTNESTEVVSNLNEIEEDVSTSDSPELKYYYTVTYDGNMPSGCSWTNVVESHAIYSTVDLIDGPPLCNGYYFYGWVSHDIDPDVVDFNGEPHGNYYDNPFIMPSHDVLLKAEWYKLETQKSFDGDEYGLYSIYSIITKELNNAVELDSPSHTRNATSTNVQLNSLNSTAKYTVTAVNLGNRDYHLEILDVNNNNSNIVYEIEEHPIPLTGNSNTTFTLVVKYKDGLTELPENTSDILTIRYKFKKDGAMFLSGQQVNAIMKQFISNGANYNTTNNSIKTIERFRGTPDPSKLIEENIVSVSDDDFQNPIYMWYDSDTSTIYWYTNSYKVYFNRNSDYFFARLSGLKEIKDLDDINSMFVIDMSYMFYNTGYNNVDFTLDLGSNFDTSNVNNMTYMFYQTGQVGNNFTLDLGDKFDTSNVINMSYMFYKTGQGSRVFTLDLGDKFDTSNVYNMDWMFSFIGQGSSSFNLDLGDKFDTSKVFNMTGMFYYSGSNDLGFTLNLGNKFNTKNVGKMINMFYHTGYKSTVFTLDLGDKFDTSNVTDMMGMFNCTGYKSTVFTLDLGSKFNTSRVTNMENMFAYTGFESPVFTLNLGSNFNTSNVTIMRNMFQSTGYNSTVFTLDLGDKFDTRKVTNMSGMFDHVGYSSSVFTLDLGDKFDTSNVTDMQVMFYGLGGSNPSFTTLDLGAFFDTSKVTGTYLMFGSCPYLTTIYAPSTFVTTNITYSPYMFGTPNIVGGAGTVYDSDHIDAEYARIDGGPSNPGYFTARS